MKSYTTRQNGEKFRTCKLEAYIPKKYIDLIMEHLGLTQTAAEDELMEITMDCGMSHIVAISKAIPEFGMKAALVTRYEGDHDEESPNDYIDLEKPQVFFRKRLIVKN